MPEIKVDGSEVKVPQGVTVLHACQVTDTEFETPIVEAAE